MKFLTITRGKLVYFAANLVTFIIWISVSVNYQKNEYATELTKE